jgi:ATP-dependent DNA ligase
LDETRETQSIRLGATLAPRKWLSFPPGFIPPCIPIASDKCKSGKAWVHEIKHDGYRLIARRNGDRVRLYTRRGYVWTDRSPCIVDALRAQRRDRGNSGAFVGQPIETCLAVGFAIGQCHTIDKRCRSWYE